MSHTVGETGLTLIGGGARVGYAGGRIRQTEFRDGPPPVSHPDADEETPADPAKP